MSKIIILDWDDTLFPTTWSITKDIDIANTGTKFKFYFTDLDKILYEFLNKCIKLATVFIVTNAVKKWVYKSALVLPKTRSLLNKIKVISARDIYQKKTLDIAKWKLGVFKYIADNFTNPYVIYHIISIGDADYEFNALLELLTHNNIKNNSYLKAIKLMPLPSFDDLSDQLEVLDTSIKKICGFEKHMDLKFTVRN